MKFTVVGAGGFIGSHLVRSLKAAGHDVTALRRNDALPGGGLGHVIFAAGITADFRERPFDTLRAHVTLPADVLEKAQFESFCYLSSARIYSGAASTSEEAAILVHPELPDDLYNLSKLAGEALCLNHPNPRVRVVRLSNVVGGGGSPRDFVPAIVREALTHHHVLLHTALDSEKDYIAIGDVLQLLPRIVMGGKRRIYNLASGKNATHRQILEMIAARVPCTFAAEEGAPAVRFPPVSVRRIAEEFAYVPGDLGPALDELIASLRRPEGSHAQR
ncbi:MAG TPA: SDR family oxidoreductase [Terriglobales bacterium]|nr:SDR family oxidoreductase [Terriglobales bacterium]